MKIDKKQIEQEVCAISGFTNPKIISAGYYEIQNKSNIATTLKNMNLESIINILMEEFDNAAEKFGIPLERVVLKKDGYNSYLTGTRLETVEEVDKRIKLEVERRVRRIQEENKQASRYKYNQKQKLIKLKKEIEELEKQTNG